MIYLYETIPGSDGEAVNRYEIKQSIHDAPLTRHPETGEAIRRVIVGGAGIITRKAASAPKATGGGGCGCGHGGCSH